MNYGVKILRKAISDFIHMPVKEYKKLLRIAKLRKQCGEIFGEMSKGGIEKLKESVDKHVGGDIAKMLIYSGALDIKSKKER